MNRIESLTNPQRLWSRHEVQSRPCPVPASPGAYGWYFREIPPGIDPSQCVEHDGLRLLYVGISPNRPPLNGKPPSRQTLRTRIVYHYRGNAEGSTLPKTLGCLLAERLRITLQRVGSGRRLTFCEGEQILSDWMAENAYVCWTEDREPWILEEHLLATLDLPLNLDGNARHPFHAVLTKARADAKSATERSPIRSDF